MALLSSACFLLLHSLVRTVGVTEMVRCCRCDCLATVQVFSFRLWVMVLVEEGCGEMQVNGPLGQNDLGNKEQENAEKHRRKWMGKRNLELSVWIPRQEVDLFQQTIAHHQHAYFKLQICDTYSYWRWHVTHMAAEGDVYDSHGCWKWHLWLFGYWRWC